MVLTLSSFSALFRRNLQRKSALSAALISCLLINIQVSKAEAVLTEENLTLPALSLPANSLDQAISDKQQPQPANTELKDSVKKLLSSLDEELTIDNTRGTTPAAPLKSASPKIDTETAVSEKNPVPIQQALVKATELSHTAQPVDKDILQGDARKLLSQTTENTLINNQHSAPILPSMISAPVQENLSEPLQTTDISSPQSDPSKPLKNADSLNSQTLEQATKSSISNDQITSTANPLPARYQPSQDNYTPHTDVTDICNKIGKKLSSISVEDCLNLEFLPPRFYSNKGELILEKHYPASPDTKTPVKILFIGGIHGDEYSSISVTFKWLKTLDENHSGAYDWHFLPLANPDGLLKKRASRVNANNVDLNRNFIPSEAAVNPLQHWQTYAKKRPRYYPGTKPLSEPESQAIHKLIDELKPDVIVSVHAPHGILDFDGSIQPPRKLGPLYLKQLGTYPGSLGNYGWFVKSIPVMTIELKHAGIMPKKDEISRMWTDLIGWIKLRTSGKNSLLARREASPE